METEAIRLSLLDQKVSTSSVGEAPDTRIERKRRTKLTTTIEPNPSTKIKTIKWGNKTAAEIISLLDSSSGDEAEEEVVEDSETASEGELEEIERGKVRNRRGEAQMVDGEAMSSVPIDYKERVRSLPAISPPRKVGKQEAEREESEKEEEVDSGFQEAAERSLQSLTKSLFGGIDRAQMERERLERARLKSLKRSGDEMNVDAADMGEIPGERKVKSVKSLGSSNHVIRNPSNISTTEIRDTRKPKVEQSTTTSSASIGDESSSGLLYPNGIVKKTYVEGYSRSGDDITLEEVLQRVRMSYIYVVASGGNQFVNSVIWD